MAFRHFLEKAEWRNDAFRHFPQHSATFRLSAFSRTRHPANYSTKFDNCIHVNLTVHICSYVIHFTVSCFITTGAVPCEMLPILCLFGL